MATTLSWKNNATGNWSTGANWSTGVAPTNADTVVINQGTATVDTSTDVASTVTLSGGKLSLASSGVELNISNNFTQTAGAFSMTNGTLIAGSVGFNASGSAKTFSITGGTFTDNGALTVTGTGSFTDDATTTVSGTAAFTDTTGATIGGAGNPLISYNTMTVGAAVSVSTGTLTVSSGALTVNGSQTLSMTSGTIVATAGGIVDNGTISGKGKLTGTISGTGAVTATAANLLDLVSNVTSTTNTFNIANSATSILKLDGTTASGTTISFTSGTSTGILELNDVTGSTVNFSGAVFNMDAGSSSTKNSVSGLDYINVQSTPITNAVLNGAGNSIELFDGATDLGAIALSTAHAGDFANWQSDTTVTGGNKVGSGTDIWLNNVVCFAAGTNILTEAGNTSVEQITEGDMVIAVDGAEAIARRVKWVGYRRIDLVRHPQPNLAAPVRIRRDAFGENLPQRDLVVSPDHCLFVDDKLIPAKLLLNDMTIVQERDTHMVEYYHIELDRHAVLLAEGLPAESYLDTGNRAFFSNAGLALVLHPEFHVNAGLKHWEKDACAPLAVSEAAVEPVWRRLAERAESLGFARPQPVMTDDPDLRVVANGRTIRPLSRDGNRYVFAVPAGVSSVRLASRATVPSYLTAYVDDWRHLGVAVRRIVVRDSAGVTELPPDHPSLTRGWYRVERDNATMWRWMNGDAVVPMPETTGPVLVEVHVGMSMTHVVEDSGVQDRLAA
jgi:hypothetical protein